MLFLLLVTILGLNAVCAPAQQVGFNPFRFPAKSKEFIAGETLEIAWEPTPKFGSRISLTLLAGPSERLQEDLDILATSIPVSPGKFGWLIPRALQQHESYGLRLSLDSDETIFQYSFPFKINFDKDPNTSKSAFKPTPDSSLPSSASPSESDVNNSGTGLSGSASANSTRTQSSTTSSATAVNASGSGRGEGNTTSTALTVGISFGVVVGVLALIVLAWFLTRRRKKKRTSIIHNDPPGSAMEMERQMAIAPATVETTHPTPTTTDPEDLGDPEEETGAPTVAVVSERDIELILDSYGSSEDVLVMSAEAEEKAMELDNGYFSERAELDADRTEKKEVYEMA